MVVRLERARRDHRPRDETVPEPAAPSETAAPVSMLYPVEMPDDPGATPSLTPRPGGGPWHPAGSLARAAFDAGYTAPRSRPRLRSAGRCRPVQASGCRLTRAVSASAGVHGERLVRDPTRLARHPIHYDVRRVVGRAQPSRSHLGPDHIL